MLCFVVPPGVWLMFRPTSIARQISAAHIAFAYLKLHILLVGSLRAAAVSIVAHLK